MPEAAWWLALVAEGGVVVDLRSAPGGWRGSARRVRALPPGSRVAVCDFSPASAWRCRRFAAHAGMAPHREYALLPGLAGPGFAVDLRAAPVSYFWAGLFAMPAGPAPLLTLAALASRAGRTRFGAAFLRALAPGRLLLGTRA